MLAIATSIDSLAVGLSFSILNISVWLPALVIGLTALLFTAGGLYLGRALKKIAQKSATGVEIFGGLVLIGHRCKNTFRPRCLWLEGDGAPFWPPSSGHPWPERPCGTVFLLIDRSISSRFMLKGFDGDAKRPPADLSSQYKFHGARQEAQGHDISGDCKTNEYS